MANVNANQTHNLNALVNLVDEQAPIAGAAQIQATPTDNAATTTPPGTGAQTTPTSDISRAQEWFFQNNLEITANNCKTKNHPNWNRNLKILRDACYERHRNRDLSRLYDEWSKETTPYFEKQFAPKLHPSDSKEIKEIK